ncbi:hypothetical protein H9P43_003203 [Blastocladiella emersonii ATCC 22665]|nr:hypothetical protein H9P43_003203 [Blastocladiella emersonii ATCC 22665]
MDAAAPTTTTTPGNPTIMDDGFDEHEHEDNVVVVSDSEIDDGDDAETAAAMPDGRALHRLTALPIPPVPASANGSASAAAAGSSSASAGAAAAAPKAPAAKGRRAAASSSASSAAAAAKKPGEKTLLHYFDLMPNKQKQNLAGASGSSTSSVVPPPPGPRSANSASAQLATFKGSPTLPAISHSLASLGVVRTAASSALEVAHHHHHHHHHLLAGASDLSEAEDSEAATAPNSPAVKPLAATPAAAARAAIPRPFHPAASRGKQPSAAALTVTFFKAVADPAFPPGDKRWLAPFARVMDLVVVHEFLFRHGVEYLPLPEQFTDPAKCTIQYLESILGDDRKFVTHGLALGAALMHHQAPYAIDLVHDAAPLDWQVLYNQQAEQRALPVYPVDAVAMSPDDRIRLFAHVVALVVQSESFRAYFKNAVENPLEPVKRERTRRYTSDLRASTTPFKNHLRVLDRDIERNVDDYNALTKAIAAADAAHDAARDAGEPIAADGIDSPAAIDHQKLLVKCLKERETATRTKRARLEQFLETRAEHLRVLEAADAKPLMLSETGTYDEYFDRARSGSHKFPPESVSVVASAAAAAAAAAGSATGSPAPAAPTGAAASTRSSTSSKRYEGLLDFGRDGDGRRYLYIRALGALVVEEGYGMVPERELTYYTCERVAQLANHLRLVPLVTRGLKKRMTETAAAIEAATMTTWAEFARRPPLRCDRDAEAMVAWAVDQVRDVVRPLVPMANRFVVLACHRLDRAHTAPRQLDEAEFEQTTHTVEALRDYLAGPFASLFLDTPAANALYKFPWRTDRNTHGSVAQYFETALPGQSLADLRKATIAAELMFWVNRFAAVFDYYFDSEVRAAASTVKGLITREHKKQTEADLLSSSGTGTASGATEYHAVPDFSTLGRTRRASVDEATAAAIAAAQDGDDGTGVNPRKRPRAAATAAKARSAAMGPRKRAKTAAAAKPASAPAKPATRSSGRTTRTSRAAPAASAPASDNDDDGDTGTGRSRRSTRARAVSKRALESMEASLLYEGDEDDEDEDAGARRSTRRKGRRIVADEDEYDDAAAAASASSDRAAMDVDDEEEEEEQVKRPSRAARAAARQARYDE